MNTKLALHRSIFFTLILLTHFRAFTIPQKYLYFYSSKECDDLWHHCTYLTEQNRSPKVQKSIVVYSLHYYFSDYTPAANWDFNIASLTTT